MSTGIYNNPADAAAKYGLEPFERVLVLMLTKYTEVKGISKAEIVNDHAPGRIHSGKGIDDYSKKVKEHHESIVGEGLWDQVQMRFKESAELYKRDASERDEDVLAMVEDSLKSSEIAEYPGRPGTRSSSAAKGWRSRDG